MSDFLERLNRRLRRKWCFLAVLPGCRRVLLNGNKEKQLLEGLVIGKESYVRESAEAAEKEARPQQTSFLK